jgi:hypothetical protein
MDTQIVSTILTVCAESKEFNLGKEVHKAIVKHGLQLKSKQDELILANGLITMYSKCGCLADAQKLSLYLSLFMNNSFDITKSI